MIRKFAFEAELFATLEFVPIAVRRKFDRVGLKVGLKQWQALDRGERLAICHLPVDSAEEREAFAIFLREAIHRHCDAEPETLPDEQRAETEPPAEPPPRLVERARAAGIPLGTDEWRRLDSDARYALVKLGAGAKAGHDLDAALKELFPGKSQV